MIRSWAPLVWLHSEELFYPSSVDFFLPEMTVQDDQGFIIQEFANAENLIGGENTSALHMQTRQPLGNIHINPNKQPHYCFLLHFRLSYVL